MDASQTLYLEAIIAREGHRLVARTGEIPSLHQLDIYVRTAADYDSRLDTSPGFERIRQTLIQTYLDERSSATQR